MLVAWESGGTPAIGLLPSLSWARWRWPHVRLVYFDVLLGRERSVANWKKTVTLSIPFSPLCQSRKVIEIWLPQLFGKRLVKDWGGKTSTTSIDVVSALNSFDTADRIMMLLWYQYLTNGECYSPFQWLVWEEGPWNVLLYAGFAKVGVFSAHLEGLRGIGWAPGGQCLQRAGATLSFQ